MNKNEELYKEYRDLENKISRRFSELLELKTEFNLLPTFNDEQELCDRAEMVESHLTLIEVRNSFNGDVDDYYFKGVDESGVYVLDKESFEEVVISLSNISDLYSQIVVIELMEEGL